MAEFWQTLNSAGALALLGWALINERRLTRLEVIEETTRHA
jgi:hypothetical protein